MSSLLDSVRFCLPSNWTNYYSDDDVHLVELSSHNCEYRLVESKMRCSRLTPYRIVRIENPRIWASYQLRKAEYETRYGETSEEMDLWHATRPSNIDSIARDNFNWRLTNRALFGQGVCFSPTAEYANRYSTGKGALILSKVLVTNIMHGSTCSTTIPPANHDTTVGVFGANKIYVKYTDDDFYPEYVVYYSKEFQAI